MERYTVDIDIELFDQMYDFWKCFKSPIMMTITPYILDQVGFQDYTLTIL